MNKLTNFVIDLKKTNKDSISKSFKDLDFQKAVVRSHQRKTKSGKIIQVKQYVDKRQKKEKVGQQKKLVSNDEKKENNFSMKRVKKELERLSNKFYDKYFDLPEDKRADFDIKDAIKIHKSNGYKVLDLANIPFKKVVSGEILPKGLFFVDDGGKFYAFVGKKMIASIDDGNEGFVEEKGEFSFDRLGYDILIINK